MGWGPTRFDLRGDLIQRVMSPWPSSFWSCFLDNFVCSGMPGVCGGIASLGGSCQLALCLSRSLPPAIISLSVKLTYTASTCRRGITTKERAAVGDLTIR